MRKQVPNGHVRAIGLRLEIPVYRVIQFHCLCFDELQHRGRGDGFAHRVRHHRRRGIQRSASRKVSPAAGVFEDDLLGRNNEILDPRRLRVSNQGVQPGADRQSARYRTFIHNWSTTDGSHKEESERGHP